MQKQKGDLFGAVQSDKITANQNLSISEYMAQRALGYEPITVLPDVFFDFYNKLCELCNTAGFTPETENKLLALIDEIHSELLLLRKEDMRKWQPPDSGLSKTG